MKKRILTLLLALLMLAALPAAAFAASPISVTVNGTAVKWTDATPYVDKNSRTMVPLRAVGEALGLTVSWNGAAREAIFSNGSKTIYFPIDKKYYKTQNGGTVTMDTAAVVSKGRTYAPVRFRVHRELERLHQDRGHHRRGPAQMGAGGIVFHCFPRYR